MKKYKVIVRVIEVEHGKGIFHQGDEDQFSYVVESEYNAEALGERIFEKIEAFEK